MPVAPFKVDQHDLWPRDEQHRYRIYAVCGAVPLVLAAAPTAEGVGAALIQLHEDEKAVGGRLSDRGRIGVLDVIEGDWVVLPFG